MMNGTDNRSPRQLVIEKASTLKTKRSSFDATCREISQYVQPQRARFNTTDANRGDKKTQFIVNNEPTQASDVNAAGMQAGITSPTKPWVRVTTEDKDLADEPDVKTWLGQLENGMLSVFSASNIYLRFYEMYVDLGDYSTSVMQVDEDVEKVINTTVFPIGSYALSANARGEVDTCYRWFQMTVRQLVEEFGYDNCSLMVRNAFDRKNFEEAREVLHAMEPNLEVIPNRIGPKGMKYSSKWLETGATEADGFLRERGYQECPFVAGRWATTGEDVYGTGAPGQKSIGDCKTLQELERRALQLSDKITDPPMVGPSSMRDEPVDLMPGGMNYEDSPSAGRGFRPAIEVRADAIAAIEQRIQAVVGRVKRTYKTDLWLMIAATDAPNAQMTATEVIEKKSEKMLQLGPMLEHFQDDVLRPLFKRVFAIMFRRGLVPRPPDVLQGTNLKLEFISILAQAQKMTGLQAIRELTSYTLQLSQAVPNAADKLDIDAVVDAYADQLGTAPKLVRTADQVAQVRAQRAAQMQAQAQAQQATQAAQNAKTLSQADTSGDNVLSRVMGSIGPTGAVG